MLPFTRFLLALCFASVVGAQVLDTSFNPSASSDVFALAAQPDGKIVVGGSFSRIGGVSRAYLARLNVDGTYDTSFGAVLTGTVYAVVLQPDGKVLVGGLLSLAGGQNRGRLVRLNADGSVDTAFNPLVTGNSVRAILLQPDGKIVIGGDFTIVAGVPRSALARLNADGTLDPSIIPDASGTVSANASVGVFVLARQADGRIVLGGQFTSFGGEPRRSIARINADGTLDTSFPSYSFTSVTALAVLRDGRIMIGGGFTVPGPVSGRANVARLTAAGEIDTSFDATASSGSRAFLEQADGKIIVGGLFTNFSNSPRSYLVRLLPDGRTDETFTPEATGILSTSPGVYALAAPTEGTIVLGGSFNAVAGQTRAGIARLVPPSPRLVTSPVATTAVSGTSVTLTAAFTGAGLTYQWRRNGTAVPGATNATLTLANSQISDAGLYDVVATNSFGSATSAAVQVSIGTPPAIITPPVATTAIPGTTANFFIVTSSAAPVTYQWQRNGTAIAGATAGSLTLNAVSSADAGNYTCVVSNAFGAVTSPAALLTVLPAARLSNLSVRTTLEAAQSLIVGYVVTGGSTDVLVRAAGPALAGFGLASAMADPRIELYRDSTKLLENDNWPAVLATSFISSGAFPFSVNSRDAALLHPATGGYSVLASGAAPGVVLVEAYDAGNGGSARLINLSARNQVGTEANILIAGFIVTGSGTKRLLIRAVGPTLGGVPFNIPGVLADPTLTVYNAAGVKLAENDNWDSALSATFTATGAFPLAPSSRDAALLLTLSAGSYTAQVAGLNATTGIALVEVYEVP